MEEIAEIDILIHQGKAFDLALRWETDPLIYKAITAIANSAPCRLTVPSHGLPPAWRAAVVGAKGMTNLNAAKNPPDVRDYYDVITVDNDTVEINSKHALDWKAHTANTGSLVYRTPFDLTGYTARMSIKDRIGGTELVSLTTENGRISLDVSGSVVLLSLDATDTAAFTWTAGVYDLELVPPTSKVAALARGVVTVEKEVTT